MSDLPEYPYQVSPDRSYSGPSPLQMSSLFGTQLQKIQLAGQAVRSIVDVGRGVANALLQQTIRVQEAYDAAQLSRAQAGYYAMMKGFAENLPYTDEPVTEWQDRYQEEATRAAQEAQDLLDRETGRYLFGGEKGQQTVRDSFEAWRMQQDAQFASAVLQSQRLKMTDEVKASLATDIAMVRSSPAYLPTFVKTVQEHVRNNVLGAEYGATLIEQAKQIALVSAVYDHARVIAEAQGVEAGAAWLADNAAMDDWMALPTGLVQSVGIGTMSLAPEQRDRVRKDFATWAGQLRATAETAQKGRAEEALRQGLESFFTGTVITDPDGTRRTEWLTLEKLQKDPRLQHDPNTPMANEYKTQVYEHLSNMLYQRNKAAMTGGKDPNEVTDETLKLSIYKMIKSRAAPYDVVYRLIYDNMGADEAGTPRLAMKDAKELFGLNDDAHPTLALDNAMSTIDQNAGATGIFTLEQAERAKAEIADAAMGREVLAMDPESGVKPMTAEEIAQMTTNKIQERLLAQFDTEFPNPKKAPEDLQRRREVVKEALAKDWYKKWGRGRGLKDGPDNLEAVVYMAQEGMLYGVLDQPQYQEMIEAARPVIRQGFRDWTGNQVGEEQAQVKVVSAGHIVLQVERPADPNQPDRGTILKFYTLSYRDDPEDLVWAEYNPLTRETTPLVDDQGRQLPYWQVRDRENAQASQRWRPPR